MTQEETHRVKYLLTSSYFTFSIEDEIQSQLKISPLVQEVDDVDQSLATIPKDLTTNTRL